ncbi:hypothetical protein EV207_14921 [Scopulibacillus darangshiensis]|uniref:DUF917 domain-containing protein n=1 Tax=Scopulibacillus darangshiensis TaxID=442528 RepID=A0A4R2NHZ4_9BACL|nr:DUF917 domain-containing protein [Scopulibacillus darangshiensis]TCP20784.1 hypothetical protein EV207_14921 [Scopulibacillus darangshiensis]
MRLIGKEEVENIAIGAALLGTGGGGDPYIGKMMAIQAIEKYGPIRLLDITELADDDVVVPSAMMGAPTVMVEKIPSGEEALVSFKALEQVLNKEIKATMPIEAGGVNSLLPLALAARMGLPVVDGDGMGRAFPELQMVTFYLNGVSTTPMVLSDEKGNSMVINTVNGEWAEKIARSATMVMGGSVMNAIYPMTGRQVKDASIYNTLTLEEKIGRTIKEAKAGKRNPVDDVLQMLGGFKLFTGKITDIERQTDGGFVRGTAIIEGLDKNKGEHCYLAFQNENLLAKTDTDVLCMTPDLITVLDTETGLPITTEGLRYGARGTVIGIPADEKWRTQKGIDIAGPRYFGYDYDFTPVETLQAKGGNK